MARVVLLTAEALSHLARNRAEELHDQMDPITQRYRTTAVLCAGAAAGSAAGLSAFISSSRSLQLVQLNAMEPYETAVPAAPGHAEIIGYDAAVAAGRSALALGVSRPICTACRASLVGTGASLRLVARAIWP
jgi:hypothetical protein